MADYNRPQGHNALVALQKQVNELRADVARLRNRNQVIMSRVGSASNARPRDGDPPEYWNLPPNPKEGQALLDSNGQPFFFANPLWRPYRPIICGASVSSFTLSNGGTSQVLPIDSVTASMGEFEVLNIGGDDFLCFPPFLGGIFSVHSTIALSNGSIAGDEGMIHPVLEILYDNARDGGNISSHVWRQLSNDDDFLGVSTIAGFPIWRSHYIYSVTSANALDPSGDGVEKRISLRFVFKNSGANSGTPSSGPVLVIFYEGMSFPVPVSGF